ncbi:hypothetical protein Taro_013902 [Colocasia esculenta]|uniref:Uncharacterized protein n=1 Tax=Colocasia esculenta TaxID=4460 RepID=A0A843UD68_COLES|nr:hypothetical protein [Colocasia esculenta]
MPFGYGPMAPLGVWPSDAECNRSICHVQVRRRPLGHRDLVATGWLSPSCSEGDTPVVAIRLFWLLFCLVVFQLLVSFQACRCCPTALSRFLEGVPCVPVPAGLVLVTSQLCRFCGDCPTYSPNAWNLRAFPVQRLSPLPGTPVLGSLLREYSGLRACSTRGSSSRELGVRRVVAAVVAPCVVSSSESECCELLFYPGSPFVASGGGSSQECSVLVSGHRCVAPVIRSVLFGWAAFWWRFSPRLLRVVLVVVALSLSVEMSCRCCRLDCPCYSLLGHCRSRCCALGRASSCHVGQLVLLVASKFLGRAGGTCVSPWLEWFASFLVPDVLLQMVCSSLPELHGGFILAVLSSHGRRWFGLGQTRASGGSRFGVLSVPWSRSWVPARDGTGVCSFLT